MVGRRKLPGPLMKPRSWVLPFRFHDCRHRFASWFASARRVLPALQKIVGHASMAMTMRYPHLSPERFRGEIARTECPGAVEPDAGTAARRCERMRRKWQSLWTNAGAVQWQNN